MTIGMSFDDNSLVLKFEFVGNRIHMDSEAYYAWKEIAGIQKILDPGNCLFRNKDA